MSRNQASGLVSVQSAFYLLALQGGLTSGISSSVSSLTYSWNLTSVLECDKNLFLAVTFSAAFFSMISQLGLLFLVVSFFSNSVRQRDGGNSTSKRDLKLKEDDILRVTCLILPAANLAISIIAKLFSGEPAMTLKGFSLALLVRNCPELLLLFGVVPQHLKMTRVPDVLEIQTYLVLNKCYRQQNVEAKVEEPEQRELQLEQQAIVGGGGGQQEQQELQKEKAIVQVEADESKK